MSPEYFEVVRAQRACRDFADTPVTDAEISTVLEAATYAPSAENKQPWVFVVVRDGDTRAAIGAIIERLWTGGAREFSRASSAESLFVEVDAALSSGLASAPVFIVVGADTTRVLEASVASSTFPAVQNLLLAANALGLGSALTTIAALAATDLRRAVDLPDHVVPVAVVPIGHPARPLGPPRREPFADHTHRDRYGTPW